MPNSVATKDDAVQVVTPSDERNPAPEPVPAEAAQPADRAARRTERRLVAILLTVGFVLFAVAIRLRMLHGYPAGDEPAYLVLSQTMQKYHSIDVMRDYLNGDYRSFSPGYLDPHVVTAPNGRTEPLHNIGGPLLWLIPFMLFGRLGVLGFMGAVSLLTVGNLYYFLRERGIDVWYAFLVTLLLTMASPIYTYSSMAFVEPIGALLILYAVRVLLGPRLSTTRVAVAATGLAVLPWVHSRFLVFTLTIGVLFAFRIYRETGRSAWRRYLPVAIPIALTLVLNEVYNIVLWGAYNPTSNMTSAGGGPFQVSPFVGLTGILLDRQDGLITNFPIFLLVLPGILLSLNRSRMWMQGMLAVVILPYLLLICTYSFWWAGYSPAARYIMVVLPLLAYYVAYALQRLDSTVAICVVIAIAIGTYAVCLASDIFPDDRFSAPGNHNKAMDRLSSLFHVRFVHQLPSAWQGPRSLFLIWLAAITVAGLALWLWGLRKRPLPGGDWVPGP